MRVYIPPAEWHGEEAALPPEEAHHLAAVLRAGPGHRLEVFNGIGETGEAELIESTRRGGRVRILSRASIPEPAVRIGLVQALIREQKMDLVVQKAVELGVCELIPVSTEHAVVQLSGRKADARKVRWEKIALNAAKQCGAARLPRIHAPDSLPAAIPACSDADLLLVGSLEKEAQPIREVLDPFEPGKPRRVCAVVGPEGDFTPAELTALRAAGAVPVSLGGRVLRAETAALYIMSVLDYALR